MTATADALAKDYQKYSEVASKYAEKAAQAGNSKAADVFNKIAEANAKAAAERGASSAADYVAKIAQDVKAGSSGLASKVGPAADFLQIGIGALDAYSKGDFSSLGKASTSVFYANIAAAIGFMLLGPGLIAGLLIGAFAEGGGFLGGLVWDSLFSNAQLFRPRSDPLILDLNGDGIGTVGTSAGILFDHNADGIATGTGWVKSDDGMLVRDINGNGLIDNGTELFGDNTLLSNGSLATDGFAALRDLDSNVDGVIDANDVAFSELRVWRDLNQDGISQADELVTLDSLGITSLATGGTTLNKSQGNGNVLAAEGTYTKTDDSTGIIGEINLALNTLRREFTDSVTISDAAAMLPDMQGSGKVRNLREAASGSSALQDILTRYSAALTRTEQMGLIDELLTKWADTSGLIDTLDDRDLSHYHIEYSSFGGVRKSDHILTPLQLEASVDVAAEGGSLLESFAPKNVDNSLIDGKRPAAPPVVFR